MPDAASFGLPALHGRFEERHQLCLVEGMVRKHAKRNPLRPHARRKRPCGFITRRSSGTAAGSSPGVTAALIGSHVLLVLHTLIFEFLNHGTGRLDPSYTAIQRKTRLCRQTVAKALARLKELGIINWIRRCREDRDERRAFHAAPERQTPTRSCRRRNGTAIPIPQCRNRHTQPHGEPPAPALAH